MLVTCHFSHFTISILFGSTLKVQNSNIGILALPRGRKRVQLEQWFGALVQTIECLPWDATISRRWAKLVVDLRQQGVMFPLLDGMIAATALVHDLIVVTRNTRDFNKTGVKVMDPFD